MSTDATAKPRKRATSKKKQKPSLPLILAALALTLSFLSLLNSHLSSERLANEKEELLAKGLHLKEQSERQKSLLSTIQNEQQTLVESLKQEELKQDRQDKQIHELSKLLTRALDENYSKKDKWKLLESDYYLSLAELSLKWSYNLPASISLLENLDRTLASLNRLDLQPIRVDVHQALAELKAITPLDEVALLSQLQVLIKQSQTLRFIETRLEKKRKRAATKETISVNEESKLKEAWQKTLESLKKVVIVRHNTKPYQALLSPDEINAITESLQLSLEQAKWALIKRNAKLYHYSLAEACKIISDYYQASSQTKSMLGTLELLQQVELSPKVPNLTPIAQRLRALSEENSPHSLNQHKGDAA